MFFSCLSKCHPAGPTLQHLSSQATLAENPLGSKSLGGKKVPWSADWTLIRVPQDLKKHLWWGPMHHRSPKRRSEGTWKGPTNWSLRHIGSYWSTQIGKSTTWQTVGCFSQQLCLSSKLFPLFMDVFGGWSSKNLQNHHLSIVNIPICFITVKVSTICWSPKKLMKPPTASPSNQSSSCFFRRATQRLPRSISLRARAWNRGTSTSKEPVWSRNHEVQPSPTFQFHCKILEPPLVTPLVTPLFTMRYYG